MTNENGKRKINAKPDQFGHYGWIVEKIGMCGYCGKKEVKGIFYSGFDQDNCFCFDCAELEGHEEEGASPSSVIRTDDGKKVVEPEKFYTVTTREHSMEDAFSYDVASGSEIIASKRGDENSRIIDQVIKEYAGQLPHRYCKQLGKCTHGREIAAQDGIKEAV